MANVYESANGWVNILIEKALQSQSLDQTILCQIKDNSAAAIGKYIVSYNSLEFNAFTDNINQKYNIDDNVYVLIPCGDYNEQKIILCKKR